MLAEKAAVFLQHLLSVRDSDIGHVGHGDVVAWRAIHEIILAQEVRLVRVLEAALQHRIARDLAHVGR